MMILKNHHRAYEWRTREVKTVIFTSRKVKKATDGLFVTSSSNRRGTIVIFAEK